LTSPLSVVLTNDINFQVPLRTSLDCASAADESIFSCRPHEIVETAVYCETRTQGSLESKGVRIRHPIPW
jgi:hypothetical protein